LARRGARHRKRPRDRQPRRRLLRNPAGFHLHAERKLMTDISWIGPTLATARPQAVAALLRYFRDLDIAEEAFQEASLRALRTWPKNGPPRDAAAWLIFVGRNAALDGVRKKSKLTAL